MNLDSFIDELEKISEEQDKEKITGERFKKFLRYGIPAAASLGVGYGTGKLIGRPIQKKVIEYGMKAGPAKVLSYALPTAAALGTAYKLARSKMISDLLEKTGDNTIRNNTS